MGTRDKLDSADVDAKLNSLTGWTVKNGKLHKDYMFASFAEAFAFMTRVAEQAGRLNHHPEWFNAYNRVIVDLISHDVGGISQRDFDFAAIIDEAAGGNGA